jgi:FtsH-binding integral membrane protein
MDDPHVVPPAEDRPDPGWDFLLVAATVAILGALGAQSLLGTLYSWWAYRTQPQWEHTGYLEFTRVMNLIGGPLVVALVVVMGLCVPKRIFPRRSLVVVSMAMLIAGALSALLSGSPAVGLTVYLAAAALIQVAVVVLTLAGASGLGYLSEGRAAKAGSGLLHLGFIVFAIVVVALQDSPAMLPVFGVAAALLFGGSTMAFYARTSSRSQKDADSD